MSKVENFNIEFSREGIAGAGGTDSGQKPGNETWWMELASLVTQGSGEAKMMAPY